MQAIILSIGDELVLGQTVDTNSAWLSQQLAAVGCDIAAHVTVPDAQEDIEIAITRAMFDLHCDILLISGGIGPTEDDLTRQALAAVMGKPLQLNEQWLTELHKFFESRGRVMPVSNRVQAMIPRGAQMIFNHAGTACGIHAQVVGERPPLTGAMTSCEVFVMPGVPKEMKAMFLRDVLPHIREQSNGAVILSRTLHTFGLGESAVAEKLGDLMRRGRNPSVGTTVSNGIVSLRINARFPSQDEAQRQLEATSKECQQALGDLIFGQDEQALPEVIARILLSRTGATVSTAESCTGGLLAKMLTDIPGSSAYFKRGWITYANEAKTDLLGVPPEVLAEHGAVSEPVVRAMATGAQQRAKSTYALAISGIAGPDGGTPTKPVGTVCIALAHEAGCDARTFILTGDREMIRDRSAKMALTMLRFHLLGKPLPF